jgi:4-hydroxyproline epimerase
MPQSSRIASASMELVAPPSRTRPDILRVVDSHTGGEPTRLVVAGGPSLRGSMGQQLEALKRDHDRVRRMVLGEPRGADHMVGALLCHSHDPRCTAGVVFFNNVGYLGMCGHGLMGLMVSLHYLGRIELGRHLIDTPVGVVEATLTDRNTVTILNVPSRRHAHDVTVDVPGFGRVTGDVAWGGNWFFLVHDHGQDVVAANIPRLTEVAVRIREALQANGITGSDGAYIDHIELMVRKPRTGIDARSFVLCPGSAYDRSPCGTGTSAVLACEHAAGRLKPDQTWLQESVIGSLFSAKLVERLGRLTPCLTGTAYVNGESRLIADPGDPFAWGLP